MLRFVVKRIIFMIPIILGINLLIFSIMYLSPNDPAFMVLGQNATNEAVEEWHEAPGLNDPFIVQYLRSLKDLVTGNFGTSYVSGRPVINDFAMRFPVTLLLAVLGLMLAVAIGIPVGVFSAVKQYSLFDYMGLFSALIFAAIPSFWFALMLILLFSMKLQLFPVSGIDSAKSFALPTITIGVLSSAPILRMTRSTMLEVIRQDYIRTIRSKGAPELYVILKHALKNAMLPIITVCGMTFGGLLGGLVVAETVFAIPGVGVFLVEAVRNQDRPIVTVVVTLLACAFSIVNLIVDIIYAFLDPHIKSEFSKTRSRKGAAHAKS